jgi:hypothetical protein
MRLSLLAAIGCLSIACGSSSSSPTIAGTWEGMAAAGVKLTAVFTPAATPSAGSSRLIQTVPVSGDTPTCSSSIIGDGAYTITGSSIAITVTSGRSTVTDCSVPDTDTAVTDLKELQGFAMTLSGPFILTETTLKLGTAYPALTRKTLAQ